MSGIIVIYRLFPMEGRKKAVSQEPRIWVLGLLGWQLLRKPSGLRVCGPWGQMAGSPFTPQTSGLVTIPSTHEGNQGEDKSLRKSDIWELGFVWDFLNPNSRVSAKTIKLGTRLEDRCVTYCHNEDNGNLPQEQRAHTLMRHCANTLNHTCSHKVM